MVSEAVQILGSAWVTPLGADIQEVMDSLLAGNIGLPEELQDERGIPTFLQMRISQSAIQETQRYARLRRSSVISHYAVSAASSCIKNAGLRIEDLQEKKVGLIFATSDGSVIYTKRFFAGITCGGAGAGSPLLFPETVHNAPASHVAATLGFTGHGLTLVGDAATGLIACSVASQWLETNVCDLVLVVGAEEIDSISCAGYATAGLARTLPTRKHQLGAIFSSGAAALLLAPAEAKNTQLQIFGAKSFAHYSQGIERLSQLVDSALTQFTPDWVLSSDAGNWVGRGETRLLRKKIPHAHHLAIKQNLGESFAVASLWQMLIANQLVMNHTATSVLITALGYNGQTSVGKISIGHFP